MNGRIYHIGLPKTGTTSIQHLLQSASYYTGVRQPRSSKQSANYEELTAFILGRKAPPPTKLPETFFYSEEMVLVNSEHGRAEANFIRLCSILRPQDTVVISTRSIIKLRESAYYEFFRYFEGMSIDSVRNHPLMQVFSGDFIGKLLSHSTTGNVVLSNLDEGHKALGEVLGIDMPLLLAETQKKNTRKHSAQGVEVKMNPKSAFPKQLFFIEKLINSVTWRISRELPQNVIQTRKRSRTKVIQPLALTEVQLLSQNVAEISDKTSNLGDVTYMNGNTTADRCW